MELQNLTNDIISMIKFEIGRTESRKNNKWIYKF